MADKITFDDKVSLTTSPLPRANKCTAEDLNEIKSVVNDNADKLDLNTIEIGNLEDSLNNRFNYSTTEKQIGNWINNKPLYQITLTGTKVYGSDLELSIPENIDNIISIEGAIKTTSGITYNLDRTEGDSYTRLEIATRTSRLTYKSSGASTYFNGDVFVTLKYTKSTD